MLGIGSGYKPGQIGAIVQGDTSGTPSSAGKRETTTLETPSS